MSIREEIVMHEMLQEYQRATKNNRVLNSAHEGYAAILEELDELWDEVKKNESKRNPFMMLHEALQISAMGLRFAVDICGQELEIEKTGEKKIKKFKRVFVGFICDYDEFLFERPEKYCRQRILHLPHKIYERKECYCTKKVKLTVEGMED